MREVWGVGRRIGAHLHKAGIKTVKALREAPPLWLRAKFGVVMERTGNELRGLSCLALEEITAPRKQIVSSRSFGQPVHTQSELGESITSYITTAAEKLRRQRSVCEAVQVFIETNPFREQDPQYSNSITIPLPNPSCDTRLLVCAALYGLQKIYRPGFAYKKAGVILIGIGDAMVSQGSLFSEHGAGDKSDRLMEALDRLNLRYGRNTVAIASAGTSRAWGMRRECMSPCYTTSWSDVPIAQAR